MMISTCYYHLTDNEIDGLAFLELTIDDLNKLLPDKLGIVKRIYCLIQAVSVNHTFKYRLGSLIFLLYEVQVVI